MRHHFREWYAPTEDELRHLWQNGTFILDSNVLLGLYQYPPATLDEFFKVLERIKERLWLPHEAGAEFHRNRAKNLPQQRAVLERLIKTVEELAAHLDSLGLPEYHPVLDLGAIETARSTVRDSFDKLLNQIRLALSETPEMRADIVFHGDPVRDRLTELFDGKVAEPLTPEELQALYKEGAERYGIDQPPGYKDKAKDHPQRYGDLVIWKEMIRNGKHKVEGLRGTIFVTNDRKEDWWLRKEERLLGPRPELVREYLGEVGDEFFMYTPAEFLRAAPEFLPQLAISQEAISEIGRISVLSPVATILRAQRMVLPEPNVRVRALGFIYDLLLSGEIQKAGDLNAAIEKFGEPLLSNYVSFPLFFSLVNQTYGLLRVGGDVSMRLRERPVHIAESAGEKDVFVRHAHAAWLSQALYRVRFESFTDEDLLVAFFGDDYSDEAPILLSQAKGSAQSDIAYARS